MVFIIKERLICRCGLLSFTRLIWRILVEGGNKSLRRKSYRTVERIKLKLVESGQDVELVEAICKYLVNHRKISAAVVQNLSDKPNPQIRLF